MIIFAFSFAQKGGWVLDTETVNAMGCPCLLAHGVGIPVSDAETTVSLPSAGMWRLWVFTRNWCEGAPGRFRIGVDGNWLPIVFGTGNSLWGWVDGGEFRAERTAVRLTVRDMTGFDGRFIAVALTRDGQMPEEKTFACFPEADVAGVFDLVVAGGGIAGCAAALAAARQGLRVALVHDREVFGGNASAEVRVWCGGEARHDIVRELRNRFMNRDSAAMHSDAYRANLLQREPNLTLFPSCTVAGCQKDADGTLTAVDVDDFRDGWRKRLAAHYFVDATGDGALGALAGATFRMGRESRGEWGEPSAPETADRQTLGCSLMWTSAEANVEMPFPDVPWAIGAAQGVAATAGEWNWEYGLDLDSIRDAEAIRDHLLAVIYGSFSLAKRDAKNARKVLDFVPYVLGKRESRRLLGDWVLKEQDIREHTPFPDAVATGTWSIDLHHRKPGRPDFLTECSQPLYGRYWIPLRSLYSREIGNLLMAGRCFSATHVALGSARVMNTTGQMGVAVGTAVALCLEQGVTPRQLAQDRTLCHMLQDRIGGEFPGHPDPVRTGWTIVDDMDPRVMVTGAWERRIHENGGHYGTGFLWAKGGTSGATVTYPFDIASPGHYRLWMIWNDYWDGRAHHVPVRISCADGAVDLIVDMTQGTGQWHLLGEFPFTAAGTLTVSAEGADGNVVADAVAVDKVSRGL